MHLHEISRFSYCMTLGRNDVAAGSTLYFDVAANIYDDCQRLMALCQL